MKRFIKIFSLVVLFIGAFFLFSSEARANFAESFSEVVDSLRGVEEEAVKIFMPQPESVDGIILGNRESEALTAEGVLFESNLSPISYLGNCDDNSIGLENREHGVKFLQAYSDLMTGSSGDNNNTSNSYLGRKNNDINKLNSWVNNPGFTQSSNCDLITVRWSPPNDISRNSKIYVNGINITENLFTNTSQILLKKGPEYRVQIVMYDNYGNTYTTGEYLVTSSGDNSKNESTAYLANTGINPTFLDLPSSTETSNESSQTPSVRPQAVFNTPTVESNFRNDGKDLIYSFTAGENVAYYQFELNGSIVYSTEPSIRIVNGNSTSYVLNISLLNTYGETGSYFNHSQGGASVQEDCTSDTSWVNKGGIEFFYYDPSSYNLPSWNSSPSEIIVKNNTLFISINPPENANSILISKNGDVFWQTGWQQDVDPNDPANNYNLNFPLPENITGEVEVFAENGAGLFSQKFKINLDQFEFVPINYDFDDPSFVPVMSTSSPFGYDMLGATQVESGFPTLDMIHDIVRVRAFKFYIDGKCIGQQRAWNIIDDSDILNTVYPLGYAVLTKLPPKSNLNYEITAVGFNGVESQPISTTLVTYLEPTIELLDIGIVDTNWIVYDEFAYIYYYLSMSKQEYQQYLSQENFVWMTVEMCCDENQRLYYPSIIFRPVPDYASCSDLTIINRSYSDNPAFLGVRTNPNLEITEFIKNDDDSALSYENSGGQLGDIIYSVNGKDVFSEVQLADAFNDLSAGENINLLVGRDGVSVNLDIELTTYPDRFNLDEINNATGCFDSSGGAVGVFKIKMSQGYQKNQYINRFQIYQRDASAESRWPTENTMFYASYKEFNKDGNIYSGIGPGDDLASYGSHNLNFSKVSFSISSNSQRSGSRPVLVTSPEISDGGENSKEEEVDETFQPSEAFATPVPRYYFDLAESEYLIENNLIPSFNKSTFGDCCFRNDSTTERGDRVFTPGAKIAYLTPEAAALEGWNLHSLTCNFVVINKEYNSDDPMYLPPSPYIPEESDLPFVTIVEQTVNLGEECQFDFGEYQQFPFYGIGVTACYVNEEGVYYCIKSDFTTFPFASWG
jgi:hypothetical protein